MSTIRTATAATSVAALVAAAATLVPASASADGPEKEVRFRVAGATADLKVEKDDGRFEVDVDLDRARPGSKWRIVLRHDGKRYYSKVKRADADGEIDVDTVRRDTRGADVFKVTVKKVNGAKKSRTIRMR